MFHNFNHNLLPQFELNRIDSPTGRRYVLPDNTSYESVTTWLSRTSDNTWLEEWRAREPNADKIVERASKRGTALHENAESFLMNKEVNVSSLNLIDKSLFIPLSKVLIDRVDNIRAVEYQLYSHSLKLAGTVDLVADFDSIPSLIDLKSTKNIKNKEDIDNYFLQTLIYSIMMEENYGVKLKKLVILMAEDYANKVHVFQEPRVNWTMKLVKLLKKFPPT